MADWRPRVRGRLLFVAGQFHPLISHGRLAPSRPGAPSFSSLLQAGSRRVNRGWPWRNRSLPQRLGAAPLAAPKERCGVGADPSARVPEFGRIPARVTDLTSAAANLREKVPLTIHELPIPGRSAASALTGSSKKTRRTQSCGSADLSRNKTSAGSLIGGSTSAGGFGNPLGPKRLSGAHRLVCRRFRAEGFPPAADRNSAGVSARN